MTFVPKKKSDSRPQPGPVNVTPAATGASTNTNNSNNKSGVYIGAIGSGQQDQPDDQPYQDHDQQQNQRSPQQQHQPTGASASEKSAHDEIGYSGYDVGHGEEHNYDRRQPQHHHHHHHNNHHQGHQHHQHHHHHHQQHHNKYMNPKSDNESTINHVILITVINPHYPITCDLIHQICSNYGKVNRIVIFKKNGVQAMVEFDNIESAKRTKTMLNGCDIYSGCCTLKIEFAKPSRLNVHKNDGESFDYTNPNLPSGPSNNQATSDSGRHEDHHASNPNHHHLHGVGHQHHVRRTGVMDRRGRGNGGGSSGDSMSNASNTIEGHSNHQSGQFHPNSHLHQTSGAQHQHSKSILSHTLSDQQQQQQLDSLHQAGGYMMGQAEDPLINSNVSTDNSFHHQHQDGGGFNVPRGGIASNAAVPSSTHQHGFGGPIENFIPTSTAQQSTQHLNPHSIHGGMYQQRQDGVHPHHHHHHHHPNQPHHHLQQPRGSANRLAEGGSGRGHNHQNSSFHNNSLVGGTGGPHHHGTVLMVYGLSVDRINCDRLFNLFCLYGNVVRIKFLRTKEGCAMVQMGDVLGMDRCYSSLNKTILFGNELQISYSKQAFLHDILQPFTLPDGSPSFKDFMGSKNNRFRNPEVASKNRILPPSRVIHFFNAPLGISDDELMVIFKQTTDYEPVSLKIFPPKDNAKSLSGLVTFRDPAEATEALVLCNHMSIPKAGVPHPYILRLCFSPPTYC